MTDGHGGTHASLRDCDPAVFWLDTPDSRPSSAPLEGHTETDLLIIGGGYTGLWAALQAKERCPDRDVLLIEADTIAAHASGRNGGFCDASITHGLPNGAKHFPNEIERLVQLGDENFAALAASIERYGIDARFERNGGLSVAYEPWQMQGLVEELALLREHGTDVEVLDRDAVRALVDSPTYVGGVRVAHGSAIVDPARLAWGLADVARSLGVRIHEHTCASRLNATPTGINAPTRQGDVRARKVLLATNALSHLVPATRRRVVPVWDYVLVTEPLSAEQLESIGWKGREGIGDAAN